MLFEPGLSGLWCGQKEGWVERVYAEIKGEVEGGISYLLRKREQDPYRDFLWRTFYEASYGGKRQAPTFVP